MKYILLIILLLIILLPPAVHGYVYPNKGDDTAVHLGAIEMMSPGSLPQMAYWGQAIVGVPMKFVSDLTGWGLDGIYLWWSYTMLALVGVVLYLVVGSLVNRWAGIIAAVMVLFVTQGVMYLFHYGQIFDIVNMFVILPIAVWFLVRWLAGKGSQWENGIMSVGMFALFSIFHSSGEYAPYALGLFFAGLVGWMLWQRRGAILGNPVRTGPPGDRPASVSGTKLVEGYLPSLPQSAIATQLATPSPPHPSGGEPPPAPPKTRPLRGLVVLPPYPLLQAAVMGAVLVGLTAWLTMTGAGTPTGGESIGSLLDAPALGRTQVGGPNVPTFLFGYLGLIPIGLVILATVVITKGRIWIKRETGLLLGVLGAFAAVLCIGSFWSNLSPDPSRQALDLAGVIGISIAVISGAAIGEKEVARADSAHVPARSSYTVPASVARTQLGVERS